MSKMKTRTFGDWSVIALGLFLASMVVLSAIGWTYSFFNQ